MRSGPLRPTTGVGRVSVMAKGSQPVPFPSCGTEPSALRHEGAAHSTRGAKDVGIPRPGHRGGRPRGTCRCDLRIPMDRTGRNGPRGTPPDQSLLRTTRVPIGNGILRVGWATCRAVCAQALSPIEVDHRMDRGVGAVMARPCGWSRREIVPMMPSRPIKSASDGGQVGSQNGEGLSGLGLHASPQAPRFAVRISVSTTIIMHHSAQHLPFRRS